MAEEQPQTRKETMVKQYVRAAQYAREAKKLAKQGWRVVSSMEHPGLMGVISRRMVVTYERDVPIKKGWFGR